MENHSLPSGTVAFLFSDVEGSTRRWEAFGEAMERAVRRHDEILRWSIAHFRGYVFKTIGDAFCAAFWSVGDALEAAVDLQRRLENEDFSAVDDLRVRVAVGAGNVDERDGDYFGPPVNRTARLLAAGHGGQILLTGEAADLVTPSLPSGITLRHLGTVALRDVKEPARVYQAMADGLERNFKPLRTLETPPNNLPAPASSFVGRHQDVLRVQRLLEDRRLVTIAGVGGMGKTRLALEAAATAINDRKDGAWFVDLAALLEERLVVSAILSALGTEQTTGKAPLETLLDYLAARETLLVLDNCEHVIGETARVVSELLQRCPRVTVLATSREALDIAGEHVYRLEGLDLRSAVNLFNERAIAASQSFAPQAEAAAVEELCRRLDGIALGIELAAARVRSIPARSLVEHLDLRVLSGGRDRRPRQRTMNALIAWSYDLLTTREQDLLRRCAACVGGFTLETATALAGTDDVTVIDLVSSLVDKSLLTLDASRARYRLLEPIRQFARERLDELGETHGAFQAHAHAYAALAHDGWNEWDTDPRPDWLTRSESELGNLRAALTWSIEERRDLETSAALAADAAPVFLRLSLFREGIQWCERVLSTGVEIALPAAARLQYGLSMLYQNEGQIAKGEECAQRALSLYRRAGDAPGLARSLSMAAHRHAVQEQFVEARANAGEAMELARAIGDRRLLADVLRRCAPSFGRDPEEMRALYKESVALFQSLGRDEETARALTWWGQSEIALGNFREAAKQLLIAKKHAGNELALSIAGDIVSCYLMVGDGRAAQVIAQEELQLATTLSHPIHTPFALMHQAVLAPEEAAPSAARLAGYAQRRLDEAGWVSGSYDDAIARRLISSLRTQLGDAELSRLLEEGALLSEEEAVARATAMLTR